jgi:hypothetical protein
VLQLVTQSADRAAQAAHIHTLLPGRSGHFSGVVSLASINARVASTAFWAEIRALSLTRGVLPITHEDYAARA